MKQIFIIIALLVSSFTMAQNTGSITGNILDLESENLPLAYAKIMVKETGAETMSDEKGVFKFENLAEGTYTLVFSFVGYETKTTETKVFNNKVTNVKQHIEASTLSIDDLALAFASADKNDTSSN